MWLRLPRNHWHCAHRSPSGAPVVTPVLLFLWPLWRVALTTAPLFPRPSSLSGSVGSGRPVFSLLSFRARQRRWSKLSPWSPPSSTLLLLASQGCLDGFNSHHWTRRFPNPRLSFCLERAANMSLSPAPNQSEYLSLPFPLIHSHYFSLSEPTGECENLPKPGFWWFSKYPRPANCHGFRLCVWYCPRPFPYCGLLNWIIR